MLEWLKRLFGVAEEVVTLAERHAEAQKLAGRAVDMFNVVIEDLETAALDLRAIAEEASAEAEGLLARADAAVTEADKNTARASKIRALLD